MIRIWAAMAAAWACVGAWAEPVSLRPAWRAGDQRSYELAAEYRQPGPEGETGRLVRQGARLALEVEEVEPSGGARLRLRFESLDAVWPGGESKWSAGEPEPDEEPIGIAGAVRHLAESTMVVTVGPDGSVQGVGGLAGLVGLLGDLDADRQPEAMAALGFFAPERLRRNLPMLWRLDPEGRARDAGSKWRTTDTVTLGEEHEVSITTDWVVEYVEGKTLAAVGTISVALVPFKGQFDPGDPRAEITAQRGTARAVWDGASGRLVERTEERMIAWRAVLDLGPGAATGPMSAESRAESLIRVRLLANGPEESAPGAAR